MSVLKLKNLELNGTELIANITSSKVFFFFGSTVFPQSLQPETNYYSHQMCPQRGKALA